MPSSVDWFKCKFLESTENLRRLLRAQTGRTPRSTLVREITACLQQGRLFYEAAERSPLEIRPLQQFYGMASFAKALVLSRTSRSLATMATTHGVRDVSPFNSRIENLTVSIYQKGAFQEFNDVARQLSRITYLGAAYKRSSVNFPTAPSSRLENVNISLKDILSRIPGLEDIYERTFGENPNQASVTVMYWPEHQDFCDFKVHQNGVIRDRDDLRRIVARTREQFQFLKNWCLHEVLDSHNPSLSFANILKTGELDDTSENHLVRFDYGYGTRVDVRSFYSEEFRRFPFLNAMDPLAGGIFSDAHTAIEPYNGHFISEFSYHYLGMFLLSSLVRYRPQVWNRAISRTVIPDMPSDDHMLAIVEYFLETNFSEIPSLIFGAFSPDASYA